jgi:uncharacterized cofD-like protein
MESRLSCPSEPMLDNMAVGNLWLSALAQRHGDMEKGVLEAQRILGTKGRVLPVTNDQADIEAVLADGTIARGETEVRRVGKEPIERMEWAGDAPDATPPVLDALAGADLLIIGPGCLFTSLWPCISVRGVPEAIRSCKGLRVFCCNTTTTPGQTDGLSISGHLRVILEALGGKGIDVMIINAEEAPLHTRRAYERMGVVQIMPSPEELELIHSWGVRTVLAPLLEKPREGPRVLHKADTLRHDPAKLRRVLDGLSAERPFPKTPLQNSRTADTQRSP